VPGARGAGRWVMGARWQGRGGRGWPGGRAQLQPIMTIVVIILSPVSVDSTRVNFMLHGGQKSKLAGNIWCGPRAGCIRLSNLLGSSTKFISPKPLIIKVGKLRGITKYR
jgi:hypothetical protein